MVKVQLQSSKEIEKSKSILIWQGSTEVNGILSDIFLILQNFKQVPLKDILEKNSSKIFFFFGWKSFTL